MNIVESNLNAESEPVKIPITQPAILSRFNSLNFRWNELCARFLPVNVSDTFWRYSRPVKQNDPEQGWKLHISATVLTASEVLEKVAPLLRNSETLFKAPVSLIHLRHLNSGLIYSYPQVGKFLTVYPKDDAEAVALAEQLHQLTAHLSAPSVPFDFRFKPDSCVYYRYGAFKTIKIENADGLATLAICDPKGNLVPDKRDAETAKPEWISNPFPSSLPVKKNTASPLRDTFKIFCALAQRGKGGVYQALDFSVLPPRLCIVKEGRRNGETDWDGRDGYNRIQHEEYVLTSLRKAGVRVPIIYSSFKTEKNYYLAVELIEGESLQNSIMKRKRRLPVSRALRYFIQLAQIVARIHSAGFVWRDVKPANLIVTKEGELRPIDFEGACLIDEPDPLPWNTTFFMPPESKDDFNHLSKPSADLFALGVIFYLLIEGELPESSNDCAPKISRRDVSPQLRQIISELLATDWTKRPGAKAVARRLEAILPAKINFK